MVLHQSGLPPYSRVLVTARSYRGRREGMSSVLAAFASSIFLCEWGCFEVVHRV